MGVRIHRRGKSSWSIRFDVAPSLDGRRRQKRIAVKGTRKDAERRAATIGAELAQGSYVGNSRLLVSDVLERWLEDCERRLQLRTVEGYRARARLYFLPTFGHRRIGDITSADVSAALALWKSCRYDRKGGHISSTTLHLIYHLLSTFFECAKSWELIARNPVRSVSAPRRDGPERTTLPLAQLQQLLAAAEDDSLRLAILIAVGLGLRCGEIAALRWGDIDTTRGVLTVRRSVVSSHGGLLYKVPKTNNSRRSLVIPAFLAEAIRAHQQRQIGILAQADVQCEDSTPLIASFGKAWSPSMLSSRFYRARKRAGVTQTFHDLRHTFATLLLMQGEDVKGVSDALGHSTISMTADTYLHVTIQLKSASAARVHNAIGSIAEGALALQPAAASHDSRS